MHPQAPRRTDDALQQVQRDTPAKASADIVCSPFVHTSFWDEQTIVSEVFSEQKKMSKVPLPKHEKKELLQCEACGKGFINQAELSNHMEVMHHAGPDEERGMAGSQQFASDLSYGVEPEEPRNDHGEATIKPRRHVADDQTIKAVPMPVTVASLNALNSSPDTELEHCMDELSISQACETSPSEVSFADTTYTVDDVDSQTISDVAEQGSPVIRESIRILLCLFMKLFLDFSQGCDAGVRQHTPYHGGNSRHGSAAQSSDSLVSGSVPSSQVSGVKRLREGDDNDDGNERKNNKARKRSGQGSPENCRPLACPFNKFDSKTFGVDGDPVYHVCSTYSDVKTAYLKQHLCRTHCMSRYSCGRCGLDCKNPADLRKHQRMDPPCAVQELDQQKIMPEIQDELGLQTRNPQKITRESYWFRVYDMIFGKQTREAREIHPYYDGPLAEHLRSFTRFSELRLPGVVQQAHQNLGNTVDRHQNYDMQFGRQILQEASRAFMAEMSRLPPPNLRESQLQSLASSTRAGQDPEPIVVKEEPRRMERRLSSYEPAGSQSWPVDSTHSSQPIFPATFQQHIPTRPMDPSSRSGAPIPISGPPSFGYQQQVEASTYYNYMPSDFEQVPFLASAEFGATIEDPDMYGPGSLTQNDLEGFTFVDNPPPNPEAYP